MTRDEQVQSLFGEIERAMLVLRAETVGDLPHELVERYRQRLRQLGFDPNHLTTRPT